MAKKIVNLAFDFGASSGRLMMSHYYDGKIEIEEIHRFPNEPVWINGRFYWDLPRQYHEIKQGLKKAAKLDVEIAGIGIDTWGVDYGFIDKEGQLLACPVVYRDPRTEESVKEVEEIVPFKEFYEQTGIQFMAINTIYHLYHDIKHRKVLVDEADALLFIPDLFAYFLCGKKFNEYSIASTSQMLDAYKKDWAYDILEKLNIPSHLFNQDIVNPGTVVGKLKEDVMKEVELPGIPIIAVGSHDTASAVCAAPLESENSAYLSCGTWSLLGMEIDKPVINEDSLQYNFTNEGGVEGKIRFLKNITGLWIIQQLKKKWSETQPDIGYPDIIAAAKKTENNHYLINPNDDRFTAPLNMVEAVQSYCEQAGQGKPETIGEIAMAAYNGITDKYREEAENMERITGKTIDVINMVGGGIQDQFLCQLTADKTGKKIVAGPIEASVLGNLLMQLKALGHVNTIEECRDIIKNSFEMKIYMPQE